MTSVTVEPDAPVDTGLTLQEIYHLPAGGHRRRLLYSLFLTNPEYTLPVNNKWQASTKDPDLKRLLKEGKLRQMREGGGRRHPKNRSSSKRQSVLVLA